MTSPDFHIAIAGQIGAGKTTLALELGIHMALRVFKEPVSDNPYLEDFYVDKAKYAFAMQIFLLNRRFKQQQEIVWSGRGAVQDRSIYEDGVFASMLHDDGLMSDLDYKTYCELFANMANFMRRPTLIVYLAVSPAEALRRIAMRGRECEKGITIEYLTKLHFAYEKFMRELARTIPVLRIDYEKFRSVDEMALAVKEFYENMGLVHEWKGSGDGENEDVNE